jgi:hypothetical protein
MSCDIGKYCKTCGLCLQAKAQKWPPMGELKPLPIPEGHWDVASVDCIVELPASQGHDTIMVVVDSVGKQAHFIETHTVVTALGAAWLYLQHVWKLHGLLWTTISDRSPQFITQFTCKLYRLLGIKLATSTAYHPQTDGQTEHVNQELEQYLRAFVSEQQNNRTELLPLAEFQYNPCPCICSTLTIPPWHWASPCMGFEPDEAPSHMETVNEFRDRMASTLEKAKSALAKAKNDMAQYYNCHRTLAPVYKIGDMVYLDSWDIHTTW